jgi:predicted transcriptional regulator of viral defense system
MYEQANLKVPVEPRHLADWLLSRGRHAVTTVEAAELLGIPLQHVAPTLARHLKRGLLFSPTKGLYIAIPPQFRSWGAVPAAQFIDAMMQHIGHEYYVCLLSAAELHGFAHQRPQVFQVMTPARLRSRSFGRVRVEFINSVSTPERAVQRVNTPTGTVSISTLETTILDMMSRPNLSGSLFNVATIVGEMVEEEGINFAKLADGSDGYARATVQRTGWLLDYVAEQVGTAVNTAPLHLALGGRSSPALLDPGGPRAGSHDDRWNVVVNEYPDEELS